MKYSIKTILKDIDDPPMLYFKNLDNDTQKEVFYNEYWKYCAKENKLPIKDIVDKKQVMLFGRSFKKLNIENGKFMFEIIDPQDMLVDRYVDPSNLDTARFICQEHIFKPLSSLYNNPLYDVEAIDRLKNFYATEEGLVKAEDNLNSLQEKNERLEDLGVIDINDPKIGEVYVELNENFIKIYDESLKRDVIKFVTTADNKEKLCEKPMHELIGKTSDNYWMDHHIFTTWGDDVERTDFWNDGVSDTIRTPNKVLNSWFSQLVENRTLRNFGMHYYDSTIEGFVPQTYEPQPWGWYPLPGKPQDVMQKVDIPDLSESLDEMTFLMGIVEKATAATSTQQGGIQPANVTLGEIQLALANAQERVKSMAILYTDSWEDFGLKYIKYLEAAGDKLDTVRIFRKGKNTGHMFTEEVNASKWDSRLGYGVEVKDLSQSASRSTDLLQKLNAARSIMPANVPLNDIYKQKVLEFAELNANEVKDVMDAEKNQVLPPMTPGMGANAGATPNPAVTTPPMQLSAPA
jgi:hypothetical protein